MRKIFKFAVLTLVFSLLFVQLCMAKKIEKPDSPLRLILNKMNVEKHVYYKGLTIFPVTSSDDFLLKNVLSLEDAIKGASFVITEESASGSVNTLIVENKSSDWIFIMAGEILTGSKQDRILKSDLLLPPKSGKVKVSAYCTEKGRWNYTSKEFSYQGSIANQTVRQKAYQTKSQSGVWSSISQVEKAAPGSAERENTTSALNFIYQDKNVEKKVDPYYKKFKDLPEKYGKIKGVIVAVGDEIICADLFGDTELFKKLWPKLLKSYIMEAVCRKDTDKKAARKDAGDFLIKAIKTDFNIVSNPGEGKLIEVISSDITGEVLVYENKLMHTGLFPKTEDGQEVQNVPPIQRNY